LKNIIIVRHAKSSWSDFSLSDFNRPLDKRGIHDAPFMAQKLKELGYKPDHIFTSDAVRAKTTAQSFQLLFDVPMTEVHSLYHGDPEDYLDVLRELDNDLGTVALFGHNPGITYIANLILPGVTENIPTCGIIIAKFESQSWDAVNWKELHLQKILVPKEIFND